MKSVSLGLVLGAVFLGFSLPVSASPGAASVVTNTNPSGLQIVTCRSDVEIDSLVRELGVSPRHIYRHALKGFAAHLPTGLISALKRDKRIIAVEEDGPVKLADQTVPAGVQRLGITNFPVAHINGHDNRINVDVAILDSGISIDHPDLNVVQAAGFADPPQDGDDWNGHGTEVAGVVGALDNDFGVVGVAPGVRLWAVQVIGETQHDWSNIIAGMDYIAQHADTISVVNASIENTVTNAPVVAISNAVWNIVDQGVVFVAAAGNSAQDLAGPDGVFGTGDDVFPAALPQVMAVSAMDPASDTIASFSNLSSFPHSPSYVTSPGGAMDVSAPGVNIFSTTLYDGTPDCYDLFSGTSAAAPHVTGLVALYIAANGRATNAEGVFRIRQAIIDNSLPQSQWRPNGQPFDPTTNPTRDPDTNAEPLAMPSENWVPLPKLAPGTNTLSGFQLTFDAVPGYDYSVQYRNSLSPVGQWTALGSSISGTGSVATASIFDPAPGLTRFYRLGRVSSP